MGLSFQEYKCILDFGRGYMFFVLGLRFLSNYPVKLISTSDVYTIQIYVPMDAMMTYSLTAAGESDEIKGAVFAQRDITDECKTTVNIIIPKRSQKYQLKLFAKRRTDIGSYSNCGEFSIVRNNASPSVEWKYPETYSCAEEYHLHIVTPLKYELKKNSPYEFKFRIKDMQKVALVDEGGEWYYLKCDPNNSSLWSLLSQTIKTSGKLTLYGKPTSSGSSNSYDGICKYKVV
jgi:hypothetical protein